MFNRNVQIDVGVNIVTKTNWISRTWSISFNFGVSALTLRAFSAFLLNESSPKGTILNKASSEEKVLSVNSIDESAMVLSNDWAAHINTSRISFDETDSLRISIHFNRLPRWWTRLVEGIYPWKWLWETGKAIPFPSKARICSRINGAMSGMSLVSLLSSLESIPTSEFKYICHPSIWRHSYWYTQIILKRIDS